MSKIQRNNFVRQHSDKQIDLQKIKNDDTAKAALAEQGVSLDKLQAADKNQDGRIDAKEAFHVADDFDHDGHRGSLIATDQRGAALPAGKALNQLGLLLDKGSLQPDAKPADQSEKAQRSEFAAAHQDEHINLTALARDDAARAKLSEAGVSMSKLRRADRNHDGKIDAREAFRVADNFDHDGHAASLDSKDASGVQTRAGKALGQLGALLGSGEVSQVHQASGEDIAAAARDRIERFGEDYGVEGVWHSPNPHVPGNAHPDSTPYSNTKGHWKCNLFGLDSVYQAGFEVPHYGKGDKGWYPIATEMHKFSEGPNPYFDKVEELHLDGLSVEEKRAKIRDLMRQAKPGDLLMANHQGPDVSDGGHTRVVVSNNMDVDGTLDCAQARQDSAQILHEDENSIGRISNYSSEEILYLLRPLRRREDEVPNS